MAREKEFDLVVQAQKGAWESRALLYKKFILNNPSVHALGSAYNNLDDFLHDCFTNVLRTATSFSAGTNLELWIESVAAWTGLERQRMHDKNPERAAQIRMCAAMEGVDGPDAARLNGYAPPTSGVRDSALSRIASILGEPNFNLFARRAVEDATWEDVAAAAGKPLNTIGPMLARAVDRLCRFFGAPPPLNDDLDPVFTWVIRDETGTKPGDPLTPTGRMIAMQLDQTFYPLTPEMRRVGLSRPAEVRSIVLWDASRVSTPPNDDLRDHLAKCSYCADLLRAMIRMQDALKKDAGTNFLLCPGGRTLANPDPASAGLEQHLAACSACRLERDQLLGLGDEEETDDESSDQAKSRRMTIWAAATLAGLLAIAAGGYWLRKSDNSVSSPQLARIEETPILRVAEDPRYSKIAQSIDISDPRWLNSVRPRNQFVFSEIVGKFAQGSVPRAILMAAPYVNTDPGIRMLYGVGLYQQRAAGDGYNEVQKAEAMPPRNSFRCWTAMQCALILGDMKVVEREAGHLASDPEYAASAQSLLARAKAVK
jgi:DNA-directed RNA polymerase specialized sigma24 family protein